ncbi:thioredoxin reductase [Clostridia bacterium]|nr:thioredoxin reductase [Clostridia bacterium]
MYDVIIIGGGTAGITAGIYTARAGKKALIIEAVVCGGQIINAKEIENYPAIQKISGADFALSLYEQAVNLGVAFAFSLVIGVTDNTDYKTVKTAKKEYSGKTVIIATGAKKRTLALEREKELTGHGVSYCATCDGTFYKNKPTAVLGGGILALEDALYLSALSSKVYLIHKGAAFSGSKNTLALLEEKENVQIFTSTATIKLLGDKTLTGIELENSKTKETFTIAVDGLFVAVGTTPQNEVFAEVVNLDEKGYIIAAEDCKTKTNGIFAAGDCRTKTLRQLTTAAADGAVAATNALLTSNK